MTNPRAIICDLDNVLADCSHRLHFVDPDKNEDCWKAYEDYHWTGTPLDRLKFTWVCGDEQKPFKPDYEAFCAGIDKDGVNEWCNQILVNLCTGKIWPIFITGRPEKYRDTTLKWLMHNIGSYFCDDRKLFMRPDFLPLSMQFDDNQKLWSPIADDRSSSEVKREIFEREIAGKYDILFCIESNQEDARMYRDLGLTVLRVMP